MNRRNVIISKHLTICEMKTVMIRIVDIRSGEDSAKTRRIALRRLHCKGFKEKKNLFLASYRCKKTAL